jgi:hypothetical protein
VNTLASGEKSPTFFDEDPLETLISCKYTVNIERAAKRLTEKIEKQIRTKTQKTEGENSSGESAAASSSEEENAVDDFPNMKIGTIRKKLAGCRDIFEKLDRYDIMSKTYYNMRLMKRDIDAPTGRRKTV